MRMRSEEPKDRLKKARMGAGLRSAAEAARRYNWPYSTYAAHENGQNQIQLESAQEYSRAFKVPASWILTGEGNPGRTTVPVRGYVGAGFVIMPLDDHEIDRIDAPLGIITPLEAVKVKGSSMTPAFYSGDVLFYAPDTDARPPMELVGRECVIKLTDGRMYLKRIEKGTRKDRFLLVSYNSDPIVDARIDWACPIRFIQRG